MMDDLKLAERQLDEFTVSIADIGKVFPFDRIEAAPVRSIQLTKLNDAGYEAPDSVYMIYMKFDATGQFIVKQISDRPYTGTLEHSEGELIKVARGLELPSGNILVEGENFDGIIWRRPHYVTIVIDNPGWKIYWGLGMLDDPLRFLPGKPGSTKDYVTNNYTFFDADPVQNLAHGDAFRFINYHHRDEFTNPLLDGDTRDYCFQIYLETPFAGTANPQSHIVLIVDPDGENQGPRT